MKRLTQTLAFCLLTVFTAVAQKNYVSEVWVSDLGNGKYKNPVLYADYSDPDACRVGDDFYMTSSSFNCLPGLQILHSKDLVNWTKHSSVLDTSAVKWAKKAMWAPSIIHKDGKYYFFFGANDVHEGEVGGIGVAVSDRPEGPYKDLLGKPLINEIVNGAQPIDQFVFRDDDGRYYMYYGGWGHCNMVKMGSDLISIVPFEDGTTYKEVTPENYIEGPFMLKHNGKYYFMWSEGDWTGPDYCVAYAIADSPFGPFKRVGKILEQDTKIANGAGHHSIIKGPGKDEWYIVYHRRPLGETDGNYRITCIDRMYFNKNGTIKPVKMTSGGIKARPLR